MTGVPPLAGNCFQTLEICQLFFFICYLLLSVLDTIYANYISSISSIIFLKMNSTELSGIIVCPGQCEQPNKDLSQAVPRNSCMPELKREGVYQDCSLAGTLFSCLTFGFLLQIFSPEKKKWQVKNKIPLCSIFTITEANACHLGSCTLLDCMFLLADVTNHTFVNFTDVATRPKSPKVLK